MADKNYTSKATRVVIDLGDIPLEVFVMPDGSYTLSEVGAEKAIDEYERSVRDFKRSKAPDALPYKDLKIGKIAVDGKGQGGKISVLPIDFVMAYWKNKALKGNKLAISLAFACVAESIERRTDKKLGVFVTEEERNERIKTRIMDNHCPWEKLYERDMCLKIQKWYGFNCTKFYWWYCYSWLTPEEKCKLEEVNPVLTLVSKNGKQRTSRKRKIHQHLDKVTRTRLTKLVQDLYSCIRFSRSRIDFERSWNAEYGAPEQLEIFDLWDFAS